jgi:hypothetical protein
MLFANKVANLHGGAKSVIFKEMTQESDKPLRSFI